MTQLNSKIIVALDFPTAKQALQFVDRLTPQLCAVKIGKELFTAAGPQLVEQLVAKDFNVFLDLKFHDIPTTVAKACTAAAKLGVWMLNVHALGGAHMLQAARAAIDAVAHKPLLIGVTLLTSLQQADLPAIGLNGTTAENVLRLASLCERSGLDGVVCSPQEVVLLREHCADEFCLVTPGIRLADDIAQDDQRRTMTPHAALQAGSSFLVIGRPITQAKDPVAVLANLNTLI